MSAILFKFTRLTRDTAAETSFIEVDLGDNQMAEGESGLNV